MSAEFVLIGGAMLSAILGLIGIAITKRENTPILGIISTDELASYRIGRLVNNGIAFCGLCQREFRPAPKASTTACPECLPPERNPIWEPHYREEHKARPLNFGKSYAPLYTYWPDLFEKGGNYENEL